MSKKRFIDTSFWSDPWVVDSLNPLDRYLFFYLLTNDKNNIAGIYEISLRTMSYETGIERDQLLNMLRNLQPKVVYNDGWIVIQNAVKNQNYANEKIRKGIEIVLESVPAELFLYMRLPKDWIPDVVKRDTPIKQIGTDESSMSHVCLPKLNDSDSDSDSDSDVRVNTHVLVKSDEPTSRPASFKILFNQLVEELGFNSSVKPTDGRIAKLKTRNRTYKSEELIRAARNLAADPFMQGENPQGKRYGDIDYLLRNDENVDKYLLLDEVASPIAKGELLDESRYL